jgi:hypothetical protein
MHRRGGLHSSWWISVVAIALATLSATGRSATPPPKRFATVDADLQRGDWSAALAALQRERARDWHFQSLTSLPEALWRQAVAEVGLGRLADALWHWHESQALARNLSPDLSAYGVAGKQLQGHPLRQAGQPPTGMMVERLGGADCVPPQKVEGDQPQLSAAPVEPEWARIEAVIDVNGRVVEPVVEAASHRALAAALLEALRGWRFEPARRAGQPVAAYYRLVVHPPVEMPLSQLAELAPREQEVDQLLRAGRHPEAAKIANKLWAETLNAGQSAAAQLALLLTLRSLVEAGAATAEGFAAPEAAQARAGGICRWQAAQILDPRFYDADLKPYGAAGDLLAANRWSEARIPESGEGTASTSGKSHRPAIRKPEKIFAPPPVIPQFLRQSPVPENIVAESMIGVDGRVSHVSLNGASSIYLAAMAFDTICDWRFKPATLEGKPFAVYYTLTINLRH